MLLLLLKEKKTETEEQISVALRDQKHCYHIFSSFFSCVLGSYFFNVFFMYQRLSLNIIRVENIVDRHTSSKKDKKNDRITSEGDDMVFYGVPRGLAERGMRGDEMRERREVVMDVEGVGEGIRGC